MGWQAATMTILDLETVGSADNSAVQSNTVTGFTEFKARAKAFPANGVHIVFVHAHDTTENLRQWHVIPCQDVEVDDADVTQGIQEISFKASLQERRSGKYHLVACAPAVTIGPNLCNQVATLENAFTLHQAPASILEPALKDSPYDSEPE